MVNFNTLVRILDSTAYAFMSLALNFFMSTKKKRIDPPSFHSGKCTRCWKSAGTWHTKLTGTAKAGFEQDGPVRKGWQVPLANLYAKTLNPG